MTTTRVVTDSACDLPEDLVTELGIGIVPLHVRFGDTELVDREELSAKEFWARCAGSPTLPETSAPAPGAFGRAFEQLAAEGAESIVCICLSSRLSATIQSATRAAHDLAGEIEVHVVDSASVTLGEGLTVVEAAVAASAGKSGVEVVAAATSAAERVQVFGAIDTLTNLRRGGRIGGAAALVGSVLAVKPVIEVRGGVVEQESKQRTRSRSLEYLAQKVIAAGPLSRLAVFSADAPDLDGFLALLSDVSAAHPTLVGDIGPVIGTHCGPGAVGVAWLPA